MGKTLLPQGNGSIGIMHSTGIPVLLALAVIGPAGRLPGRGERMPRRRLPGVGLALLPRSPLRLLARGLATLPGLLQQVPRGRPFPLFLPFPLGQPGKQTHTKFGFLTGTVTSRPISSVIRNCRRGSQMAAAMLEGGRHI